MLSALAFDSMRIILVPRAAGSALCLVLNPVLTRLAVTMQLELGSTPAPGVSSRRPRRVALPRAWSLNGESVLLAQNVAGEGASHNARVHPPQCCSGGRGGRAPLPLHSYA